MSLIKYVGDGRFLVGIPDTNLTDEEIALLAKKRLVAPALLRKVLVESGLYSESKPAKEKA